MSLIQKIRLLWATLFCCGIALAFSYSLFISLSGHLQAKSWTPQQATVTDIVQHPKSATMEYRFSVKGKVYRGDTYAFLSKGSLHDKQEIIDGYSVGDEVTVYVDPENPDNSVVLRRELSLSHVWGYLFIISAVIACLVFEWWKVLRVTRTTDGEAAVST